MDIYSTHGAVCVCNLSSPIISSSTVTCTMRGSVFMPLCYNSNFLCLVMF